MIRLGIIIFCTVLVLTTNVFALYDRVIQFVCVPEANYFAILSPEINVHDMPEANSLLPEELDPSDYRTSFVKTLRAKYHMYMGVRGFAGDFTSVQEVCKLKDTTIKVDMSIFCLWGAPCRGTTIGAYFDLWLDDQLIFQNINGFSCSHISIESIEYRDNKLWVKLQENDRKLWIDTKGGGFLGLGDDIAIASFGTSKYSQVPLPITHHLWGNIIQSIYDSEEAVFRKKIDLSNEINRDIEERQSKIVPTLSAEGARKYEEVSRSAARGGE